MLSLLFAAECAAVDFYPHKFPKTSGPLFSYIKTMHPLATKFNDYNINSITIKSNISLSKFVTEMFDLLAKEPINVSETILNYTTPFLTNVTTDSMSSREGSLNFPEINFMNAFRKAKKDNIGEENLGVLIGGALHAIFALVLAAILLVFYLFDSFLCCCCCKAQESSKASVLTCIFFHIGTVLMVISLIFTFLILPPVNDVSNKLLNVKGTYCHFCNDTYNGMNRFLGNFTEKTKDIPNGIISLGQGFSVSFNNLLDELIKDKEIVKGLIDSEDYNINIFAQFTNDEAPIKKKIDEINRKLEEANENDKKIDLSENINTIKSQIKTNLDDVEEMVSPLRDSMDDLNTFTKNFSETARKSLDLNSTFSSLLDDLHKNRNCSSLNKSNPKMDNFLGNIQDFQKKIPLFSIIFIASIAVIIVFTAVIYSGLFNGHSKCSRCCASINMLFPIMYTIIFFIIVLITSVVGFVSYVITDDINKTTLNIGTGIPNLFTDRTIGFPNMEISFVVKNYSLKFNVTGYSITFPNDYDPIKYIINNFTYVNEKINSKGLGKALDVNRILNKEELETYIKSFSNSGVDQVKKNTKRILTSEIQPRIVEYIPEDGTKIKDFELESKIAKAEESSNEDVKRLVKELKDMIYNENEAFKITYRAFKKQVETNFSKAYTDDFDSERGRFNTIMKENMTQGLDSFQNAINNLLVDLETILDGFYAYDLAGPLMYFIELFGTDLGTVGNVIPISLIFATVGFFFYALFIWIRRRGMYTLEEFREKNNEKYGLGVARDESSSASSDFSDSVYYMGNRTAEKGGKKKDDDKKEGFGDEQPENLSTFWLH